MFPENPSGGGTGGAGGGSGGSGGGSAAGGGTGGGTGGGGATLGAQWPEPRNGQLNVLVTARLAWNCYGTGSGADLYLGTTNPPPLRVSGIPEPAPGFAFVHQPSSPLAWMSQYFWRIDCRDSSARVYTGPLWTFTTKSPPCGWGGPFPACAGRPTMVDADSNTYGTIEICGKCWMASNLKTGTFTQAVEGGMGNDDIINKYCPANQAARCASQGGLYEWNEVMQHGTNGARGICPSGWHVPSDDEWKALEVGLGMSTADASLRGSVRGTDEGTRLKPGGNSGFNAVLIGAWSHAGVPVYDFVNDGTATWYWTSTQVSSGTNSWYRRVSSSSPQIARTLAAATEAYSVRCVRD